MKLRANCQTGAHLVLQKRESRRATFPLYLVNAQRHGLSLWAQDEHHPELPAMLSLVRRLRRHIWTAPPHPQQAAPASEAQQRWCRDTLSFPYSEGKKHVGILTVIPAGSL